MHKLYVQDMLLWREWKKNYEKRKQIYNIYFYSWLTLSTTLSTLVRTESERTNEPKEQKLTRIYFIHIFEEKVRMKFKIKKKQKKQKK